MRKSVVAAAVAAAVALVIAAPPQRASADGTITVTSNASIVTSASIHVRDGANFPQFLDNKNGPSATNFSSYDHALDAHVERVVPDAGPLSATSHMEQTTAIVSATDSVTVDSSGSVTGTVTSDPALKPDETISAGGNTTLQVKIASTGPVSFTVTASARTTGPTPGQSSVIFSAGGDEANRRVANANIDVGINHPTASFSHVGRLDGSPSQPAFVELDVTCRGGAGSPFTSGACSWNVHLTIGPAATDGDVYRWVQKKGGDYGTANNWDVKKVPDDDDAQRNDTAIFDLPGAYDVDVGGGGVAARAGPAPRAQTQRRAERVVVKGGQPTFLHGEVVADSASAGEPSVDVQAGGRLKVTDARLQSKDARICAPGDAPGRFSSVVVGTDGRWENAETMTVGNDKSPGGLRVEDAGFVSSRQATIQGAALVAGQTITQVKVKGVGSTWQPGILLAGPGGSGSQIAIDVLDGASVTTSLAGLGGSADVTVEVRGVALGVASRWHAESNSTFVGNGGPATFRVSEGATASAGQLLVGTGGGADGKIAVATNGEITAGSVVLGQRQGAVGRIDVLAGGRIVVNGDLDVGQTGGTGFIHVSGSDSVRGNIEVRGSMTLGASNPTGAGPHFTRGLLKVEGLDSGVFVDGDLAVGRVGEGSGSVVVRDRGQLVVGHALSIDVGTVELFDGSLNVTVLAVQPNGRLSGTGRVVVAGNVVADGEIAPGNSPGTLTIQGNLVVDATGVIDAEVAGPGEKSDRLVVTGDATMNGTLLLHFMNGFAPKAGAQFEVVHVNGATTGDFAAVQVEGLAPGAQIQTAVSGGALVVTATNDTTALPTVSAKGPKKLKERSKKPAFVTISRTGATAAPLTVTYLVEGTAQNGVDYSLLSGKATIPARKKSATVRIAPINDFAREGDETVRISVVPGPAYSRSLRPSAELLLVDDER